MKFLHGASALVLAVSSATSAQADFTFSPRFFLYFDNASQRQSGFDEIAGLADDETAEQSEELSEFFGTPVDVSVDDVTSASINNQIVYPLFGAAFTADLDQARRTQVTVSAFYGKANSRLRSLQNVRQTVSVMGFEAEDILAFSMDGKARTKRLDLEATVQHRLNERFALLGGLRYERLRSKGKFDFNFTSSSNASNLFGLLFGAGDIDIGLSDSNGTMTVGVNDNLYSARVGGAAFAPIGQRNMVYVNGLVHLTHQAGTSGKSRLVVPDLDSDETNSIDIDSETSIGPDISVGYQHRLTETIGLDVRYRGIFYFPISGTKDFDDPRVNHGINAGLTFSF